MTEHPHYWTTAEVRTLRELYPTLGPRGIGDLLPGRTLSSVMSRASAEGVRYLGPRREGRRVKWDATDEIDTQIRGVYQASPPASGAARRLAEEIGYPYWWVTRRAAELGVARPAKKQPLWTAEEEEILQRHHGSDLEVIRRRLAAAGYKRTRTAIQIRRKRLALSPRPDGRYTAGGIAKLLGVDPKTPTYWIQAGWLEGERRGTERLDCQGGDMWWVTHEDLRRFVINNPHLVDLRKITDAEWFIGMVAGGAADGRQNRRRRPGREAA